MKPTQVALLVSAWIEMATTVSAGTHDLVALLVSAWIEIHFTSL